MSTWLKHKIKHNDLNDINLDPGVTISKSCYKSNKLVESTFQQT